MHPSLRLLTIAGLALGAAACGDVTQANTAAPHATLSLYGMSAGSALSAIVLGSPSDGDSLHPGRIDPVNVDSIVVNITGVALRPRLHDGDTLFPEPEDSLELPEQPGGMEGPFGPGNPPPPGHHGDRHGGARDGSGPDSVHADGDSLPRWILLDVVSGGHVDLMHLPTDSGSGIVVAAGDVPAGDYNGVRLEISDGAIYLKTDVVTPMGDTLAAGTAIPVRFLSRGIMIRADVTVPDGGGDFPIIFDAATTIGNAILTPQGDVIITPVMRHCHGGPGGHMEPDND